jgi:uncharacterized protein (DUF486 family)
MWRCFPFKWLDFAAISGATASPNPSFALFVESHPMANRIGHTVYSTAELKTMQQVITLSVFSVFSVFYLKESFTWQHVAGFALIGGGATLIFKA